MRPTPIAGLILLASACYGSDSAVYTPAGASVWNDGYPATVLAIPPGAPGGTVQIASFGVVELAPADMAPINTFHVRIAVANNAGERPWNVDVAGATLQAADGESRTLLANSDLGTLPIALVDRGEPRTIDLYFALPPGIRDEEDLPEVDFSVPLTAPARAVRAQTHFTRREPSEVTGARKDAVRVAGWGSRWWADPTYAWPTFHRNAGAITPRPPAQATVSRLPRWQRPPQPRSAWR